jgi:hypothetical protein
LLAAGQPASQAAMAMMATHARVPRYRRQK